MYDGVGDDVFFTFNRELVHVFDYVRAGGTPKSAAIFRIFGHIFQHVSEYAYHSLRG